MAILTREAILGAQDLKRQTVAVKEWGGEMILTELTADRRLEFEKLLPEDGEEEAIWLLLVAFCCRGRGRSGAVYAGRRAGLGVRKTARF